MTTNHGLIDLLGRFWRHLSRRRRRQFVMVFGLMVISALTEVISLGAVLLFISVLVAPQWVQVASARQLQSYVTELKKSCAATSRRPGR